MKLIDGLLIAAILATAAFVWHSTAEATELVQADTRYGYTSESRDFKIAADGCPDCTHYDWELVWYEHDDVVDAGSIALPAATVMSCGREGYPLTVNLPRTGHYYLRARRCIEARCSTWISTLDASTTLNQHCDPRAVWDYGTVQPPETPVFN